MEAFLRDPAFGWDYARMVHGEQSITLHRPLYAGDEVVTTMHVDELATRAGSHLLTLRCEVADAAGEPVATTKALLVTQATPRALRGGGSRRQGRRAPAAVAAGHAGRPRAVRGRVRRLQPDPLERPLRRRRGPAQRHRARHADDGARRAARHPVGGRPGRGPRYGVRFTRPVVVPDDDEGALVEITGTVRAVADGVATVAITAVVDGKTVLGRAQAEVVLPGCPPRRCPVDARIGASGDALRRPSARRLAPIRRGGRCCARRIRHRKGSAMKFAKLVDKAWEDKTAAEILAAPPSALEGLTEKHDEVLKGLGHQDRGRPGEVEVRQPRGRAGGARRPGQVAATTAGRVGCPAPCGGAVHSICWARRLLRCAPPAREPESV